MSPEIGPLSYGQKDREAFQKPFSEATAQKLDQEVHNLVARAHKRTTEMLKKHRADVEKVAQRLMKQEVLSR